MEGFADAVGAGGVWHGGWHWLVWLFGGESVAGLQRVETVRQAPALAVPVEHAGEMFAGNSQLHGGMG